MADEPKNPQQIIDDATKALGQTTAPPPQPETVIISPKDQKPESPPQIPMQPKKKGGKGMLIGILLFFILTLPVAIYYGTQQITEIRSRAAVLVDFVCMPAKIECTEANGTVVSSGCIDTCKSPRICCKISVSVTNTPTPSPIAPSCNTGNCYNDCICKNFAPEDCRDACPAATATPTPVTSTEKCCPKFNTAYSINTCTGASQNACNININYCEWKKPLCTPVNPPTQPPGGNTPTPGGGACTNRAKDGTWHGCDYIHNSGGTGPVASGCENNPSKGNDFNNCGGKPCCQFTFKCGVYCLAASCGAAACYDAAGSYMYVCNTNTWQCTKTSSKYTSITACEGGND